MLPFLTPLLALVLPWLLPRRGVVTLDEAVALKFRAEDLIGSYGRELTLLDVDVVGSTLLKRDQSPANIAHSFKAYHGYVAEVTRACGGPGRTVDR